jgi:hypothetical protein
MSLSQHILSIVLLQVSSHLLTISIIFEGNSPDLFLPDAGVIEREWQERYGHVVRFKAAFGVRIQSRCQWKDCID